MRPDTAMIRNDPWIANGYEVASHQEVVDQMTHRLKVICPIAPLGKFARPNFPTDGQDYSALALHSARQKQTNRFAFHSSLSLTELIVSLVAMMDVAKCTPVV